MGSYTTNLRLYKPVDRENGWAAAVNANFDLLDKILSWNIHLISSAEAILPSDAVVIFDRTAGDLAVVLPAQVDCVPSKPIFVKVKKDGQGDTRRVTLTSEDSADINGQSSLGFTSEGESCILVPTGDGWEVL